MSELCKVPKEPNKLVSITPNQLVKFPVNQLCAGKRQNTVCAVDSDVSVYIYNMIYTREFLTVAIASRGASRFVSA